MEKEPCQFKNTEQCPVFVKTGECFEDRHHEYYPANEYQSQLERRFRGLGANILKICRHLHNERHANDPIPEKPPAKVMRAAIKASIRKNPNNE